jgi:nucleoid DNA-binding protein
VGNYRTQFFLNLLEVLVMAKKSGSKPLTKTEIMRSISETTGLQKKDVVAVMEALTDEIQKALKGQGIGVFSIPGLVKIERRKVPARPAQKGEREGSRACPQEPEGHGELTPARSQRLGGIMSHKQLTGGAFVAPPVFLF